VRRCRARIVASPALRASRAARWNCGVRSIASASARSAGDAISRAFSSSSLSCGGGVTGAGGSSAAMGRAPGGSSWRSVNMPGATSTKLSSVISASDISAQAAVSADTPRGGGCGVNSCCFSAWCRMSLSVMPVRGDIDTMMTPAARCAEPGANCATSVKALGADSGGDGIQPAAVVARRWCMAATGPEQEQHRQRAQAAQRRLRRARRLLWANSRQMRGSRGRGGA